MYYIYTTEDRSQARWYEYKTFELSEAVCGLVVRVGGLVRLGIYLHLGYVFQTHANAWRVNIYCCREGIQSQLTSNYFSSK